MRLLSSSSYADILVLPLVPWKSAPKCSTEDGMFWCAINVCRISGCVQIKTWLSIITSNSATNLQLPLTFQYAESCSFTPHLHNLTPPTLDTLYLSECRRSGLNNTLGLQDRKCESCRFVFQTSVLLSFCCSFPVCVCVSFLRLFYSFYTNKSAVLKKRKI